MRTIATQFVFSETHSSRQFHSLELSSRALRDLSDDDDSTWDLEIGKSSRSESTDFVLREAHSLARYDCCSHHFAQMSIGQGETGGLGNSGRTEEHVIHLPRRNLF